ncbi:MAG: prepilin-type cleavage/methylation domain-containing protein [Methylotenera sp.]|nr:prepilin-type cleavage/methylation domain-containing protein [Methylotenera sp.]
MTKANISHVAGKFQNGVVLLESLIAILLFSMGILALVGLQGTMVKNTSEAKYRAEATFIAQQKLGEIWVGTSLADYVVDVGDAAADISTLLPNGTRTVTVSPERVVTVTVSWQLPGEIQHNYSTNARIEGI